jgi:hypothetical protein
MGGAQTLNLVASRPKDFGYVGVFRSAVIFGWAADWEKEHKDGLDDKAAREGLKLLWFATGKEDFLLARTKETVELLKKHDFKPGLQGNRRRPHLDQLAEVPPRVRAAAVPVRSG